MASVYGVVDDSDTQSEPNRGQRSRTASPPFVTEIISISIALSGELYRILVSLEVLSLMFYLLFALSSGRDLLFALSSSVSDK